MDWSSLAHYAIVVGALAMEAGVLPDGMAQDDEDMPEDDLPAGAPAGDDMRVSDPFAVGSVGWFATAEGLATAPDTDPDTDPAAKA